MTELTQQRKEASQAYIESAFDFEGNPIGSRDWCEFWRGWQASRSSLESENAELRKENGRLRDAMRQILILAHDPFFLIGMDMLKKVIDDAIRGGTNV